VIDSDRFALEVFEDGALLVDLAKGGFFRLNVSAAFVWQRTLAGWDASAVVDALMRTYGLDTSAAARDRVSALDLPVARLTPPSDEEMHYAKVGTIYQFSWRNQALFEVTDDGGRIRSLRPFDPGELPAYLRAISAKVLALGGVSVLHAGAVLTSPETVTAFLGVSGAGKTTSAHAFAHAGCKLVCEDKLVLDPNSTADMAVMDGEARISAWAQDTRARMQASPSDWHDTRTIFHIADGPKQRLERLWIVDSSRRETDLRLRRMGRSEAAGAIFHHGFYGSADPHALRRHLKRAADMARRLVVDEATMPSGIPSLRAAARRYTENTAS